MLKYLLKSLTISGFLLLTFCIRAQQYTFINFSTEHGLPQSQVTALCQDNSGYLWFATLGGVSRFDGIEFLNFSNKDGLIDNQSYSLFIDSKQKIYIGSVGGYSVYDGKGFTPVKLPQLYNTSNISAFTEDDLKNIWFVTENMGVGKISPNGQISFYDEKKGLNSNTRTIYFDNNKQLWVGTRYGLFLFDKNKDHFSPVNINGVPDRNISYITRDKYNNIWVATVDEGVYVKHHNTWINFDETNGLISNQIRSITVCSDSSIWFSSRLGISIFKNNSFNNINTDKGLTHSNIRYIGEDNEKNIWICTDGKGIYKFAGEAFVTYTVKTGLSSDFVMSLVEDADKNLWFSTYDKGVCKYNGTNIICFDDSKYLSNNTVWTSTRDAENNLWFGTSIGLNKYDGKKFYIYTDDDGLLSNKITALYADNENLWIGTQNGLNRFYKGTFSSCLNQNGPNPDNIRNIYKDKQGVLWLASSNGLYAYNGKTFKQYKPFPENSDNTLYCIKPALKQGLWVGTKSGLFYFNNSRFEPVVFSDGVSSNYINFLLNDYIYLWIGTNNGIYRLNQQKYFEEAIIEIKNFTRDEGVPGMETNMNAAYKDSRGYLWFGTDKGLVRFNADKEKKYDALIKPYIHIDDVRLYFEKADWKNYTDVFDENTGLPLDPKVNYKKNHFTFYYTGISHTNPKKLKYRFKLEGFDPDWSPETDARFITYSNLPYGSYTFMVKAKNEQGIWSHTATFAFTIKAPFWLTWWFIVMCSILVLFLIIFLYNIRLKEIKRKNERQQLIYQSRLLELEQQALNASMNRHFIFNALNSIQYYINKQDRLEANRYLTSFAKLIRKNLDSSASGQMVSLSEELERLELYISLENMRFKNKFTYQINIQNDIDTQNVKIPPMLLQPYVENSIWHGILPLEQPGHIQLNINSLPDGSIKFAIEDNGIGIETSLMEKNKTKNNHISRGIEITSGRLVVLKKILNEEIIINGPFELKNNLGLACGTRVEIIIPQPKRPFPKI
jgi:streptogramin lyase